VRRPDIDSLVAAIAIACLATAGVLACTGAKADEVTVGLHLASVHIPSYSYQNNFNPGFYARFDNGVTVGSYYNTLRRASIYAGWTTPEFAYVSVTAGVVTGYQKKTWTQ